MDEYFILGMRKNGKMYFMHAWDRPEELPLGLFLWTTNVNNAEVLYGTESEMRDLISRLGRPGIFFKPAYHHDQMTFYEAHV